MWTVQDAELFDLLERIVAEIVLPSVFKRTARRGDITANGLLHPECEAIRRQVP